MKKRKIPMRRCVVSNEQFPKKELIRVVRTPEGEVAIDPSGKMNGRGAYVATDPDIVQKAWDKHLLDKHLEVSVDDAFYNELKDYADHMKARKELYGNE